METSTHKKTVVVTGGNGFVAMHCILQLLEQHYQVKTTVRSPEKKEELLGLLKEAGSKSAAGIEFFEADLTKDANWDKAMSGSDYVLHVASPITLQAPKHEDEMIRPAVDGTLRVLKAARNAGVKRVVMTSNFGAVGYSHKDTTTLITEEDWTNPNEKNLSSYNKSKVMAEKAAWNFMKTEGGDMEFSVINPVGIFGPYYGGRLSSGFELINRILNGSMKSIPNMTLSIVDVRDLADLHIKAMTHPSANGQRFLALSDGVWSLPEIAIFLKSKLGERGNKISTKKLPDWIIHITALFSPVSKNLSSMIGRYRDASNKKAKMVLGWQPRSKEEAILAAAESILKYS